MENVDRFEQPDFEYSNVRYMYVNGGGVANGDNDFIMQVETSLPSGVVDVQNLIMTPRMAKGMRDMLNDAIDNYEELVGEIYTGTKVSDDYKSIDDESSNDEEEI